MLCGLLVQPPLSETYSHKMPQNLPLQPVSSKRNLRV